MLEGKMESFCREYILDYSPQRAALRAGYSKGSYGNQLLKRGDIMERIFTLQEELVKTSLLENKNRILREYWAMYERAIQAQPVTVWDKELKEYVPTGEYLSEEGATKAELGKLVLDSGAVTSVFGRAGSVSAHTGDYTYDMVGAAPAKHKAQHLSGEDAITLSDLGGASESHSHGNITADGKLGSFNGMIVTTGEGGVLEAKGKSTLGFEFSPQEVQITGAFTAENNKIYIGNGISSFNFTCDSAKIASCHGWITFGSTVGTVTLSGFDFIDDADEIENAERNSRWEFDLERGCLIIKKR